MKKSVRLTGLLVMTILIMCTTFAYAQDWPQFRGPDRDGVSQETELLTSWPEDGPEVLWTVDVGIGYGGPVVKDGRVYLLDRDDDVGDYMRCFDLSSGEELWSYGYDAPGSVMFPGSRSVPAIDGDYVYSVGPYGDLYCIDINTHEPVWNKNVWTDFGGGRIPTWAITQCPLIYEDLVIVASQAPQAGVVAYDKLTGDVEWTTAPIGPVGYVSPTLVNISGEDHVVMISAIERGDGKVAGIEPLTGDILWEYTGWECRLPVPIATDAGENRVLIVGGYEAGAAMIRIDEEGNGNYGVTELYKNIDFGAHTKPALKVDDYFYAQYSTNERRDGLVCMSMDGEIMWNTGRSPSFDKGSMILVDDMILATDGGANLYLIEPDPSEFKPVASANMLGRGQNWAPIALVDGLLLIRDQSQMKCVRVAQ